MCVLCLSILPVCMSIDIYLYSHIHTHIYAAQGKGEAADLLLNDLAKTKPYLRSKVKGLVRVDDTHLTHRQILQLVRKIVVGHEDPRKERVIHGQPLPPPGRK